jgi:hypothetical protein
MTPVKTDSIQRQIETYNPRVISHTHLLRELVVASMSPASRNAAGTHAVIKEPVTLLVWRLVLTRTPVSVGDIQISITASSAVPSPP